MKRKVFFPILALAIIATAVASSSFVSAQDAAGPNSLVVAIAQKFNLNQNDVQAVFDEERSKHQAEMKTRIEQKLTQAVANGKITETQKQAIVTHFTKMKNNHLTKQGFQDLTSEQRKAKMEQKKAEMDAWLSQNGLTRELLQEIMGGPRGFGKRMMFKN